MEYGLGRKVAPDHRDMNHPMRALLSVDAPKKPFGYWHGGMFLDQGPTPQCVEYSWHHFLQTGRIRPSGKYPYWTPGSVYPEMQKIDEWPGEDYDGTSVRAGAKMLWAMGYINEYHWAWDLETVIDAVTRLGPVVMGTNWYSDMFEPDSRGRVKLGGYQAGGHAWLIDGANRKQGLIRAKNSWGRAWGLNGRFWMPFEDLERLINEDGEACIATEVQR